jgi:transposase
LALSAGQAADMRAVPDLLVGLPADSDVVADRGYDYADVRLRIQAAGCHAHVPTTRQKLTQISVAPALYQQRNLIERCFNRLKHYYLSAVAIAAIRLWTRFESRT